MRVKKFEGATMRDAIAKVKAALGEHAVIISTREVRKGLLGSGVEISAAIDDDDTAAHDAGPLPAKHEDVEKLLGPLRTELRSLRAIVRTSGDKSGATELRNELAALRKMIEELRPAAAPQAAAPASSARAKRATESQLVAPSTGKIIMLIGPTGAGKTTTIAKLAARAALIDQRTVGLITLDNYRVGGIDQIRTFADLIGLPLQVAESPAALPDLINPTNDLTLIDTAGRSPRDVAAIAELARHVTGLAIEVHLVVPAATSALHLDQLVARYKALSPTRLLFTKIDEVERAPEVSAAPIRTGLPITWVTTGQSVPEDIEEPDAIRVLDLASNGLAALTTESAA